MTLEVDVQVRRGALDLDVRFAAGAGEVVALLGPNGAGKSTLVRVLAGLLRPDHGHVVLAGRPLDDAAVTVPASERRVGVVFQDRLLFPHLTVLDNVAFGLRVQGGDPAAVRRRALRWLDDLGVADLASRRPGTLSGGEQQRVALARALAAEPRLLLLDEPFAALDVSSRHAVRRDVRRHLQGFGGPCLLVTHDPLDALTLADRLVVIEAGRVTQSGTIAAVTRSPRSPWVARLVGVNLFRGRGEGTDVVLAGGERVSTADPVPADAFAMFPPQAVALHPGRPQGTPRNVWPLTVQGLEQHGTRVRVQLAGAVPLTAEVTAAAAADLDLAADDAVWASVKATEVAVYPV